MIAQVRNTANSTAVERCVADTGQAVVQVVILKVLKLRPGQQTMTSAATILMKLSWLSGRARSAHFAVDSTILDYFKRQKFSRVQTKIPGPTLKKDRKRLFACRAAGKRGDELCIACALQTYYHTRAWHGLTPKTREPRQTTRRIK